MTEISRSIQLRILSTLCLSMRQVRLVWLTAHALTIGQGEIERLEAQHRVFNLMFDGKLIFPPLTKVENVLDCGYGSASWAIEVAEEYPDCEVRIFICPYQEV